MKILCATLLVGAISVSPVGVVHADDTETPSWASTTWMAHDTTKQVQMAYRYAQSYDYEKALEHLRIAAQRGYPQAQAQVGYYYQEGLGGVEADPVEAVKWYLRAAEQEIAPAQCNLGLCYQSGRGVERDIQKAIHWFLRAAKQGDKTAQHNLGIYYASLEAEAAREAEEQAEAETADPTESP